MNLKNYVRLLSFLLTLVLTVSLCPVAGAEESTVHTFFEENFDDNSYGKWDRRDGVNYLVKSDEGYGNSLAMQMDKPVNLWKYFDGTDKYDVINISFDMKNEYQYPLFSLKLLGKKTEDLTADADYVIDIHKWSVDGNPVVRSWHYEFWKNEESWTCPQGQTNWFHYSGFNWYNVNIWINNYNRYVYYYMNDAYVGRTKLPDNIQTVEGFVFNTLARDASHHFNVGVSGEPEVWLDNIGVYGINGDNYSEINEVYPEELLNNIEMTFSSDPGNIFFDTDEVYFDVKYDVIGDRISTDSSIKVTYDFMDDTEKLLYTTSKEIKLEGKTSVTDRVRAENLPLDYGYHIFRTTVQDESGRTITKQQKFSNLHTPTKQNYKFGYADHYRWRESMYNDYADPEIGYAIEAKIGMGNTRYSVSWGDMLDNEDKQLQLPEIYKSDMEIARKNGIKGVTGVMSWNRADEQHLVPITESPPRSESAQAKFGEYVYEYVKQVTEMGGVEAYFEVWNEYSARFSQFNLDGATWDDYYNLLKVSYTQMKKANPDAKLLGFTTARHHEEMTRRVLDLGGGDYFDVYCIHPYPYNFGATPEDGGVIDQVKQLRATLDEYGLQDKEIWLSEIGYSSGDGYCTEEEQASYNTRTAAMLNGLVGKVWWYVGFNKDVNDDLERNFGALRLWKEEDVTYEAKSALIAMSNWNALMTDAETVNIHKVNEDIDAYEYTFPDGKDAYVLWSRDGNQNVSLNLGAESAVQYDMYGNGSKIDALNGEFQVYVTENPMYLMGDFNGFSSSEPKISVDLKDKFGIVDNDVRTLRIVSSAGANLDISEELPNNVEMISQKVLVGGENQVLFKTGITNGAGEIVLNIGKDGKNYMHFRVPVQKVAAADVSFNILPSGNTWQGVMDITNNTRNHNIGGQFLIDQPSRFAETIGKVTVLPVAPQTSKKVVFAFPDDYAADNIEISGELQLDNGDVISLSRFTDLYKVAYAKKKPTIDGRIENGEWDTDEILITGRENYVARGRQWLGEKDLKARAYLMWDNDYLYVGTVVDDDYLDYDREQKRIWAGDSVQVDVATQRSGSAKFSEIGMGIVDGVPRLDRYYFESNGVTESLDTGDKNVEYKITRDETAKQTVYELKIGWNELMPKDFIIGKQDTLTLSLLINENDEGARTGWFEFGTGVGSGQKNPSKFKEMPLGKK